MLQAYGISSFDSNGMKSDNPHAGIYEAETCRTLDLNGGSPACNQGGMAVVHCYPIEGNGQRPSHKGDGWNDTDVSFTLNTTEQHAVGKIMVLNDQGGAFMDVSYDKVGTLRSQMGGHLPVIVLESNQNHARATEDGISPTLPASMGMGGGYIPMIVDAQDRQVCAVKDDVTVKTDESGVAFALDTMHRQQAVMLEHHPNDSRIKIADDGICQALTSRMGTGGGNVPLLMDVGFFQVHEDQAGTLLARMYKDPPIVCTSGEEVKEPKYVHLEVRRLTPLECERLQGFPDGWTDIGDWVDSKGKTHSGDSDTPRYKALGNSIAVGYANNGSGFWMNLMKRISAQFERNATLASLFDGIGGFPLAWEHYNGKGSAIWASEIEEFCIAVTKKHFGEE